MKNSASNNFYQVFLRTGDPMCLLLARDCEKTEKLKKKIIQKENKDNLSL